MQEAGSKASLVEVLRAVEGMGDGLVDGCCAGDVRDAVVHVSKRLSILEGMPPGNGRRHPPEWTVRDEWAVRVLLRAFGKLAVRDGKSHADRG